MTRWKFNYCLGSETEFFLVISFNVMTLYKQSSPLCNVIIF